jgi:non-homologous end joining protein Ku
VPDGEVGQQAFAVVREAIRKEGMVALARMVFTSREYVIALEPRGKLRKIKVRKRLGIQLNPQQSIGRH